MTSLTKSTAKLNDDHYIHFIGGPYYDDANSNKVLFPFTFKNGVLDINDATGFNIASGQTPKNVGTSDGGLVRLQGGLNLVQSIGPNFQTYIASCVWGPNPTYAVSSPSSVKVYKPGVVSRVQQLDYTSNLPANINHSADAYVVSSNPPDSDFTFASLPNYGVTYAFNKPLVVSVKTVGAGTQYITFFSTWDH